MSMRSLLLEQVKVLQGIRDDVDTDDVVEMIELAETDDLDCTNVHHNTYPKVFFAAGYIRGVAEERNCTIRELFEQEDIET